MIRRKLMLPLLSAALLYSAPVGAQGFPEGPGREILERECSTCHSPDMVRTVGRGIDEWEEIVLTMNDQGAKVSDEQLPILVEYLAKNWPSKSSGAGGASSTPAPSAAAPAAAAPAPASPAAASPAAAGTPPTGAAASQEMPADYKAVLSALGLQGDFRDGVLKVNIPRSDLKVVVDGIATPTPFGFGGWVALEKGSGGMDVMMGDLVLTEAEVNPVMSALLDGGLEVTALHNHFLLETPRIFYMHVHGHGASADLASKLKPALALVGKTAISGGPTGKALDGPLDTAKLAEIVGTPGESNGGVYKITVARPDIQIVEMGAPINSRMGLNTWAAFYGTDADAVVAGDVAMLDREIQPVLKALRSNGINVVAMHHHMVGTTPAVTFLHYWGRGPAQKLAAGVRAAVTVAGK